MGLLSVRMDDPRAFILLHVGAEDRDEAQLLLFLSRLHQ